MSHTESSSDIAQLPPIAHDFGFSDGHELARQEARRFLGERWPIAAVRKWVDQDRVFDASAWAEMAALGWLGLGADQEFGGSGLDRLHEALLFEELGRALCPLPFLANTLALAALELGGSAAQRAEFIPAIIAGETRAALGLWEPGGAWEPSAFSLRAEPADGGWSLSGIKTHVLGGDVATLGLVASSDPDGETSLYAVELPQAGLTVEREVTVDRTRSSARWTFQGVRVAKSSRFEGDASRALNATLIRAWVVSAAEMIGGAERLLELTRAYAAERRQFGRAIGSFQAVKHPIVDMMIGVELARNLELGAAAALDQAPSCSSISARMAKAMASDVFAFAAHKAVQLHGGFGFTWDCDVQLYFKRALASRALLGDATHHRQRLASALLDG